MSRWPYNTARWQRLRIAKLMECPVCEPCRARGVIEIAEVVDHDKAINAGGDAFPPLSFGFNVPEGGDEWRGEKRTLKAIDLREISVVQAFPAYSGTSLAVRSRKPMTDAERRIRILELEGGAYVAV
ncbi:hypothetical protein G6M70_07035 [Agrobacterium tumefaciens]|uniref:HK97 family phage prohead protease n=1 Tax=Agrobacterium tumefaciens TaxID=358 RepID=UPI0015719D8D|nr:HK97 family phage prohead protease [Agrobacterium tumefaciens]NSZ01218.1 hypothetical protein [Agrobacterium tumefaciens]NSZ37160.1 hypothetical protein [Agrobacterium tumefaciens]NTB24904.1 hypothetical protein [Agrobacterium tumefaciens]NTB30801.1 hypothetical protein [Agrobacterium tumefaciens]NTB35964.1 hypothetical protein [Agrobacterium tumefaciens]